MKLFEVPYNFDEKLIKYYKKHASRINFLYIPPYKDDSIHTRSSIQTNTVGHCYMPQTRSEYERHIRLIVEADLHFVVLWQIRTEKISTKLLEYYSKLGTSGFIVGNDENAKIIKDYDKSLLVICSLVQRLRTNILKRDFRYYDYIILYYTFNRALDAIKQLSPFKDKIVLMPNTLCNIECPSLHHWFPTKDKPFNPEKDCWVKLEEMNQCGMIFPEHLHLFNDYVGGFKLQGREYPTEAIKYLCHFYFEEEYFSEFVEPFLREDMAKELYRLSHSVQAEDYYNYYTEKVIKKL